MDAAICVDSRCSLGEGIIWDAHNRRVLWTDIDSSVIWSYTPGTGDVRRWKVPDRVGMLASCSRGNVLIGMTKGLYVVDLDAASDEHLAVTKLVDVEPDCRDTRINDGRSDRDGNIVFGTMNESPGHPATGHFYQYSSANGLRRLDVGPAAIPNSICFSRDGRTIWFCDSLDRTIRCGNYDPADATITGIEIFARLAPDEGLPDGSIVDADGYVWNAAWAGGVVRRYDPDGRIERVVRIPTKHPTCPAFGGPDCSILYVTSSRNEHTEDELAGSPQAGGLFSVAIPGIRGVVDTPFAL